MKIIDKGGPTAQPTISSTDIPVGTVFRGNVWGTISQSWTRGVFYKANAAATIQCATRFGDVVLVRLDAPGIQPNGFSNLWLYASSVRDYEPLNVELHILGSA